MTLSGMSFIDLWHSGYMGRGVLTSEEMFSRRAASLPEPDKNTILLFVSSVLMNGRTCRTIQRLVKMLALLVKTTGCNERNAAIHSVFALQQGCL